AGACPEYWEKLSGDVEDKCYLFVRPLLSWFDGVVVPSCLHKTGAPELAPQNLQGDFLCLPALHWVWLAAHILAGTKVWSRISNNTRIKYTNFYCPNPDNYQGSKKLNYSYILIYLYFIYVYIYMTQKACCGRSRQ
ncbi:unnamed protein product, partial [Candidula unifasciata]